MSILAKVRRQGGAAVVTIPPALLKVLAIEVGSTLTLTASEGQLIAQPVRTTRRRYTLQELLVGSEHVAALTQETAWAREGEPVGHELT